MKFDLHTHSVYSDGTWTPRQLLEAAAKEALTIALTDHNTVSGLPEFMEIAAELGIEAVPGTEFSTDYQGKELHIVALFLRPEHYAAVRDYVAEGDRLKDQSNRDLICRLQAAGYAIDYQQILDKTPDGRVNRALIGAELVEKGYVATVKEAFATLLKEKHGFYVPPKRPDAYDTIAFIRTLGAVPVLAHPYLSMEPEMVEAFLPEAVARGLLAMETRYTTYDAPTTALAQQVAARFGLLESGGSDFHGAVKPNNPLGGVGIPQEAYQALKNAVQ